MRAPKEASLDEVVERIVAEFIDKDASQKLLCERFNVRQRKAALETDIRQTIRLLRERDREIAYRSSSKERMPIRGKRDENDEDFAALLKQIKGLQEALKKAGAPALFLLLSGESDVRSDRVPPSDVQHKVEQRINEVVGMLGYLRARCEWLRAERPGEHGNTGYRQRLVAHEAWRLLRRHGKSPTSGAPGSDYGDVASLLYEAMTGKEKDLQRACKAALQLANEGQILIS
jgi:hypothetical protein